MSWRYLHRALVGCGGFYGVGVCLTTIGYVWVDHFFSRFELLGLRARWSLRMGHAPGGSLCSRSHKGLIGLTSRLASVRAPSGYSSLFARKWADGELTNPMRYRLLICGWSHIGKKGWMICPHRLMKPGCTLPEHISKATSLNMVYMWKFICGYRVRGCGRLYGSVIVQTVHKLAKTQVLVDKKRICGSFICG